jgi:uncharacterized protein with PIN domain
MRDPRTPENTKTEFCTGCKKSTKWRETVTEHLDKDRFEHFWRCNECERSFLVGTWRGDGQKID